MINTDMGRKLTTDEFIEKARKVHGNLYDYSKVEYKYAKTKICIIDPIYGEFYQVPNDHLTGCGCPDRKKGGKLTTEVFIERANMIHNNLYDYSKVNYKHSNTKVCIIDPIFGRFYQIPTDHLSKRGCPDRSYNGKHSIHKDHIIPLTILGTRKEIDRNRPLYKFLNSSINIQTIPGNENSKKSDWINIDEKQIRARNVRNDYEIIAYLSETLLDININEIIKEDQIYCNL